MKAMAEDVVRRLREKRLTLGVVESATGGLISAAITDVPGASECFHGAIVSYSNNIKERTVGVRRRTLEQHGAVSPQVAQEMAEGGRRVLGVDVCVADTGIAGPGGATPDKPVGLFYLGLAHAGGVFHRQHTFKGNRRQNREDAAAAALTWVAEHLDSLH